VSLDPPLPSGAPKPISGDFILYRHHANTISDPPFVSREWMTTFFEGMQQDIRVGTFTAQTSHPPESQIPSGLADTVQPLTVVDIYAVTHMDPVYGALTGSNMIGGYYVSVWYNDLHAIVTEGPVRGPRTKDHFIRNSVEPDWEERQRAIVPYSDPDFQDKIYAAVKHYFEARSVYTTLEGASDRAFDIGAWVASGGEWIAPGSYTHSIECP